MIKQLNTKLTNNSTTTTTKGATTREGKKNRKLIFTRITELFT